MPIALAFVFSALLHGAAVVLPGWDLPGQGEPEPLIIEAKIALPPRPEKTAATVAERPKPARTAAKRVATQAASTDKPSLSPEPSAESASSVSQTAPMAPPTPEPAAIPPPQPEPPFARIGRVRYLVTYGDGGFVIGETIHEWRVENGRYTLRSSAEPKGLAALRGKPRWQESAGEILAGGLRPGEFRDRRDGRDAEVATFDWESGRVNFSGGRGEARIDAGGQDLLSVFYQLAWLAPRQTTDFLVATGGRVGRWKFEWLGEEALELASGSMPALHLRTQADGDTTEVWLVPRHGNLPLKIRHTNRKGDAFEQIADTLDLH